MLEAYEEDLYEFTRTVAHEKKEEEEEERGGERRASSRITQDARVFPLLALVHPDGNRPRKRKHVRVGYIKDWCVPGNEIPWIRSEIGILRFLRLTETSRRTCARE